MSCVPTHGHTANSSGPNRASPEYRSWRSMKDRCLRPSRDHAEYYGMAIHQPWLEDFSAFLADMGPRPSLNHTLDRIDGSRGYFPDNCRWATKVEQARNRRNNVYPGKSVASAASEAGLTVSTVRSRLRRGRSLSEALAPKGTVIRCGHNGDCVRGEKNARAKLTEATVREILTSPASGGALAKKLGVSRTVVNMVRRREIWRHINV